MLIFNPQLPPKEGYVEVENENGERIYQAVQTPQSDTDAILVDLEYRMTLMELGVN